MRSWCVGAGLDQRGRDSVGSPVQLGPADAPVAVHERGRAPSFSSDGFPDIGVVPRPASHVIVTDARVTRPAS